MPIRVTEVGQALRRFTAIDQRRLLLGLGLAFLHGQLPALADNFGRWETPLGSCQLQYASKEGQQPARDQACLRLRLDQNLEGLLSARFLTNKQELVFAGTLVGGQRPMRCNSEGGCTPEWPTRLSVSTVAEGPIDRSGLTSAIPYAQLAKGECQITRHAIECQALTPAGDRWSAKAPL